MTNLQLIVLCDAYSVCTEIDSNNQSTPTNLTQIDQLIKNDMITLNNQCPIGYGYKYKITKKGKFWLDYVLKLPYPVEVKEWRMPNE